MGSVLEPKWIEPKYGVLLRLHHTVVSWLSDGWWRRHLDRSGKVSVETADMLPDGWKYWLEWNKLCNAGNVTPASEAEMLALDTGRNFGFTRCVARRVESAELERWPTFSQRRD